MDKIRMDTMEFWGYHGVLPEEQLKGQPFIVDVELFLDLEKAAAEDRLDATVNYGELYERIRNVVENERYALIEALAKRILTEATIDSKVKKAKVCVKKPQAPIQGKFNYMAVEMVRER